MKYTSIIFIAMAMISLSSCDGNDFEDRVPVPANEYVDDGIERQEHGYMDLGLPSGTLWAISNLGTKNKTDKGLLYTWGDTKGYKAGEIEFSWDNYVFIRVKTNSYYGVPIDEYLLSKYSLTKENAYYLPDKKTTLDLEDDAAHINWGGKWRIPSDEQFDELCNYCQIEKTAGEAVKFTGPNGNSIVLPSGDYWTRTLVPNEEFYAYRYTVDHEHSNIKGAGGLRYHGYCIRPVMSK